MWAGGRPLSPGLLVGAQTAHSTVPGTAADTGVGGGEAADSTEGALGPGRGSRTGRQVVRALGHAQVLQRQGGGAGSPPWGLPCQLLSPAPPARPESFFGSGV